MYKGHKFDMRIHIVVTNLDPLTVYVHPVGKAKFAMIKHSTPGVNSKFNKEQHLTFTPLTWEYTKLPIQDEDIYVTEPINEFLTNLASQPELFKGEITKLSNEARKAQLWKEIITTV